MKKEDLTSIETAIWMTMAAFGYSRERATREVLDAIETHKPPLYETLDDGTIKRRHPRKWHT